MREEPGRPAARGCDASGAPGGPVAAARARTRAARPAGTSRPRHPGLWTEAGRGDRATTVAWRAAAGAGPARRLAAAGAVREVVQSAPAAMPGSSGAAGAAGAADGGSAPGGLAHERLLPGCWSRPASPSSLRRRVRVASRSGPSRSSIQRLVSCACRRPRAARSCPAGVRAISCRRRLPGSVLLVIRSRARSRSRRG